MAGPGTQPLTPDGMAAPAGWQHQAAGGESSPAVGESLLFVAEARRDWDRTGVIIEEGCCWLTCMGHLWRDAQVPRCAPGGRGATGLLDLRRCMTAGRRLRREPWMRLVATVAHPRQWDLLERDLAESVKLLFHNDPPGLTRLLAPIGWDLAVPGWSNGVQASLPHLFANELFANDWRQMASDNSGGVQLRITRLATPDPGVPAWMLRACSGWSRQQGGERIR